MINLSFSDVLAQFVKRSAYSAGQLAELSDVPKTTIISWMDGRVNRPRHHSDLLQLARALNLTSQETAVLLEAAGYAKTAEDIRQAPKESVQDSAAPFQAIPELPYFVGREEIIKDIQSQLSTADAQRICIIHGMGGIGKTTLVAHLAYRTRYLFPDGVLWGDVGHSEPMAILQAFAQAYGVDVSHYRDLASRSQVVRQLLADKRILLVLDDVWYSADLRHLLPPSTGAANVLITTRRNDLLASGAVHRIGLGLFDEDRPDSLALFQQRLGSAFVRREEEALKEIAHSLGHLPLAIAIIANHLALDPDWSVEYILKVLRQKQGTLADLAYDDQSVSLSFHVGYDSLPTEMKQFFMKLAVFQDRAFRPETAAFVTQISPDTARRFLRRLYTLSLVQVQGQPGEHNWRCYHLHPLMREFALEEAQKANVVHTARQQLARLPDARVNGRSHNSVTPLK
ncbi:MAG: hypothetical protein CL608_15870 [Anaerolineaceae bacterium]|nr:hypothetical protein [Anaerolineaceae bacterium]